MSLGIKVIITLSCYGLIWAGVHLNVLWAIIVGALLAGSTTTKLIIEIIEDRGAHN